MGVADPHALVWELASINAGVSFAISIDLPALHHELWNDSLNLAAVVVQVASQFSRRELQKVVTSLRQYILEHFNHNLRLGVPFLPRLAYLKF